MPDVKIGTSTTGAIAQAITAGFKLMKTVVDTAEVRRMRKAIDAGEKYIQVNNKEGRFSDLTDEQQKKKLSYYRRRFFKYN